MRSARIGCLFRMAAPAVNRPEQVAARADSMVDRVRALGTHVLLFRAAIFCGCSPLAGWRWSAARRKIPPAQHRESECAGL